MIYMTKGSYVASNNVIEMPKGSHAMQTPKGSHVMQMPMGVM